MSRFTSLVCTLGFLVSLVSSSLSAQTFTQLADYVVDSGWVAEGISGDVSTGVLRRGDTIVRFDAISGVHRDTIILPGLMNLIYIGTSLYAITDEAIDSKDYYVVRRCLESTNVFTRTTIRWPHFEGGGYPYHTRFPKFVVSTSSRLMYVYVQHGIHEDVRNLVEIQRGSPEFGRLEITTNPSTSRRSPNEFQTYEVRIDRRF